MPLQIGRSILVWTLPQRNAERGETVQGVQGQEFRNHRNLFRPEAGTLEKGGKRTEDDLATGL